jgi:hypothetical protein
MYRRLFSFLNQPFYEQKYIILVKILRMFCDSAYISGRNSLKMVTTKWFHKVGYNSSPYLSREIRNIHEIGSTGFARYLLPYRIFKLGPISVIRYPKVNINNPTTDAETIYLLRDLSNFSKKTRIDVRNLHFVKDFLKINPSWHEEVHYLKHMELSALFGPIHGDFHRGNILRYEGELSLIDFDMFEQAGMHHFDFLNQFWLAENFFSESAVWFDYLQKMFHRWNELESHEYWSDLSSIEKKDIFYLFAIYKLNEITRYRKSAESDQRYRDILKEIRNLPV